MWIGHTKGKAGANLERIDQVQLQPRDSSSFYLRDSHGMEFKTTNSNIIQLSRHTCNPLWRPEKESLKGKLFPLSCKGFFLLFKTYSLLSRFFLCQSISNYQYRQYNMRFSKLALLENRNKSLNDF